MNPLLGALHRRQVKLAGHHLMTGRMEPRPIDYDDQDDPDDQLDQDDPDYQDDQDDQDQDAISPGSVRGPAGRLCRRTWQW